MQSFYFAVVYGVAAFGSLCGVCWNDSRLQRLLGMIATICFVICATIHAMLYSLGANP